MEAVQDLLQQFDEGFTPPGQPAELKREAVVFNGRYTITFPDGSHKTFKISTKPRDARFAPGKRIISLLTGPDNENDYSPFGFVDDSGVAVWKKYRGAVVPSKYEEYAVILWELATMVEVPGHTLLVAGTCLRCNRPLTDPESILTGVGPTCRERLGW